MSNSSAPLPLWMKNYTKPNDNINPAKKNEHVDTVRKVRVESNLGAPAEGSVISSFWQIAEFSEKLLLKAEKEEFIIGLDLDFPATYKSVLSKASQIHICYGQNQCCILKVQSCGSLPRALILLLKHNNISFAGYNLIDDLHKLGRDFKVDVSTLIEKVRGSELHFSDNIYCKHNWDLESAAKKPTLSSKERDKKPLASTTLFKFPGKVRYFDSFPTCAAAAEELLERAEGFTGSKKFILGFDLEWPIGGKVALIQICPDKYECYLLHITKLQTLPKTVVLLLNHPNIKLVGVNIANDIRKIGRDYKIETQKILANIIDIGTYANSVLNISERWSLDRLVLHMLGMELEKPHNVRCSNWDVDDLSEKQIHYAAADAFAGIEVYNHLRGIEVGTVARSSSYCQ